MPAGWRRLYAGSPHRSSASSLRITSRTRSPESTSRSADARALTKRLPYLNQKECGCGADARCRAGASRACLSGTEAVMPRIGFALTATAATISYALAGCSALMFDRSQQRPSPPSPQTLQFQSEPTGADVHTVQGQMCQTPCSLALPVESQLVTFAKNGFLSQTVQISVDQPPPEHSFFSKRPPPTLRPNQVRVVLQTAPPPLERPAPPPRQPAPPPVNTIPWFPS